MFCLYGANVKDVTPRFGSLRKWRHPEYESGVCCAVFSLWFVRVGRVIHAQTTVPCAAFGCNNKSRNPGVEGIVTEYTHSLLFR